MKTEKMEMHKRSSDTSSVCTDLESLEGPPLQEAEQECCPDLLGEGSPWWLRIVGWSVVWSPRPQLLLFCFMSFYSFQFLKLKMRRESMDCLLFILSKGWAAVDTPMFPFFPQVGVRCGPPAGHHVQILMHILVTASI